MSVEIEAAVLDGAGTARRRRFLRHKPEHTRPPGSPCANCGVTLQGPWCHACGQLAEDFHRSVGHLLAETVESFTHFDGRFWHTLPRLAWKPGQLTRDYIDGHRAGQIPPLRLFLVALLLLFFAGSFSGHLASPIQLQTSSDDKGAPGRHVHSLKDLTPRERAKFDKDIADVKVELGKPDVAASQWLQTRLTAALTDPDRFTQVLEQWSERFAFLMLPIATAIVSLLFVFQRRFYVFDHTIFALHSLSFFGLLLSSAFALSRGLGAWPFLLMLAAPAHLFAHMRGVYRTGVVGTLLRMALLFLGSLIGFGFLMLGLLWVGLSALGSAA